MAQESSSSGNRREFFRFDVKLEQSVLKAHHPSATLNIPKMLLLKRLLLGDDLKEGSE